MRYGICYGLECGHHTDKEFTEIPFDEIQDITDYNKVYWDSLIAHYYNFVKAIPGINLQYCKKCNQMKRIIRMNIFMDNITFRNTGSNIKT